MKKKIALALASLLALTLVLTTPLYLQDTTVEAQYPPWHWKIMLAQKYANARIRGNLTYYGEVLPGTNFDLWCILENEEALGQFVFAKVPTDVIPNDIHFEKWIDYDLDGIWDYYIYVEEPFPGPGYPWPEEPHTWYQHVETEADIPPQYPPPPWPFMVVVEVREQPYDPDDPNFYWQLTIKQHGVNAHWWGWLTDELGLEIIGTNFDIICNGTNPLGVDLKSIVVSTPWCTVPRDIHWSLDIDGAHVVIDAHTIITQFPWKWTETVGPGQNVTLELTEVQMHKYIVMGGETNSDGQLGPFAPWNRTSYLDNGGVPFASRPPYLTPMLTEQVITFTQRDPITGIVKLGVPAESYVGLDHTYWSPRVTYYFNVKITLETAGCGWLFTGVGKQPILGSVDYKTYNNNTGVYTYGPDGLAGTADDELLAGQVPGLGAYPPDGVTPGAGGAGLPIGPCLQLLRGPDDIPGTGDDPIGRGDPDGPNPPGSSILYLPTTMTVTYWLADQWNLLFSSPWPQLLTTGTAYDKVIESASVIDGWEFSRTGQPWEFFAGLDNNTGGAMVPWKDKKCNAYVTYVAAWSVMETETALGTLDVHFVIVEKKVREDVLIADINCDEVCNIIDIVIAALSFDKRDEGFGNPVADPGYDPRGDLRPERGLVNIVDIVRIALDFDEKLQP